MVADSCSKLIPLFWQGDRLNGSNTPGRVIEALLSVSSVFQEGIRYTASGFAFSSALMDLDQRSVQFDKEQDHILQQAIPGVRPLDGDKELSSKSMAASLPDTETLAKVCAKYFPHET